MKMFQDFDVAGENWIVTCPACGGEHYQDNRLDESVYRLAAQEAPRFKQEGRIDDALDVLTAFSAVRIGNYLRPRWKCECGALFDA